MQTETYKFDSPHTLRNKIARLLWTIVWRLFFRPTPWFMRSWRRMLLKIFGAKLGNAEFDASVQIWAPWLLEAGDHVFVDRDVKLYNAYGITIGDRVVISQGVFLCTPSHDHTITTFPLIGKKITIGNDTWLAAEAFIAPGVTVSEGAVVGARAVVVKDVPPWTVVAGNPAREIKKRELRKPA